MSKKDNFRQSAEQLRTELGQDSPLAALVEAGPDKMEEAADALTRRIKVYEGKIDQRVVKEFSRLVSETANEREDDLSSVEPFHIYRVVYPEVMEEVRNKTPLGVQYYQLMVAQMPHRFYFK